MMILSKSKAERPTRTKGKDLPLERLDSFVYLIDEPADDRFLSAKRIAQYDYTKTIKIHKAYLTIVELVEPLLVVKAKERLSLGEGEVDEGSGEGLSLQ